MNDSAAEFYDHFAGEYHLLLADWARSVAWQGEVIDQLIRAELGDGGRTVLDCACGIGTQALGLAQRGYRVHATDISPAAVERAAREAAELGVELSVSVADLQSLAEQVDGRFDVVLAFDNALPHLLEDGDLRDAVRSMAAKTRPGGLVMASIRDYDRLVAERPGTEGPRVFDDPEGRRITFQVWDWAADGRTYRLHQFLLRQRDGAWQTSHAETDCRALLRDDLTEAMTSAGLVDVRWLMPEDSGYYQPVVLGRR